MTLSATPKSLSISSIASPPINNNRQQIITHFSPILTRRSKIEHGLPSRSISPRDIPTNFIFRPPMSHRSSSLKLDSRLKTIAEHPVKSPLIPSISIPRLSEQDSIHTRTLTSTLYAKSRLIKQWRKHHHSSPLNNFDQINDIEQLSINARLMNNYHREDSIKQSKCQLKDDGKYSITFPHPMIFFIESEMNILFVTFKSKIEIFLFIEKDSDHLLLSDENSSTSTCQSQLTPPNSSETDLLSFSSSSSSSKSILKKRIYPRRRIYNHALPPVTEYFDDEETGDRI